MLYQRLILQGLSHVSIGTYFFPRAFLHNFLDKNKKDIH